jgi:hypothetical protein
MRQNAAPNLIRGRFFCALALILCFSTNIVIPAKAGIHGQRDDVTLTLLRKEGLGHGFPPSRE